MSWNRRDVWSPGMEASFVDHVLLRPKSSPYGTRTVAPRFGAEEMDDDDLLDAVEDDFWDLSAYELEHVDLEELDEKYDLFGDEEEDAYGRLYMTSDYRLDKADPADLGTIVGRSGSSGLRGGRSTFGATLQIGNFSYSGDDLGAFLLGLGFVAVMAKSVKVI